MIVDFRYHIFTITAVFAALGLGILIGTSIVGQDGFIKEQQKIINNIAQDINHLRMENSRLSQDKKKLKEKLLDRRKMEYKFLSFFLKDEMSGEEFTIFTAGETIPPETEEIFNISGAKLNIINNINQLKKVKVEETNKLIFWEIGKTDKNYRHFQEKYKGNILFYQDNNLPELILTLMENKSNEKQEKSIGNHSGVQRREDNKTDPG